MSKLPPPIEEVTVPETFSPSQLAIARECRLRAVFASLGSAIPRLPTHPAAERGTVFHRLLERAARGLIPRAPTPGEAVRRELALLLEQAETRLSKDPATAHFAKLADSVTRLVWHNAVQGALVTAERLLRDASLGSRSQLPDLKIEAIRFDRLHDPGSWAEVRIDAPSLRLSGRIDVVEKTPPNVVVIRDYKTGQIREWDGSIRPHIELQLRLYALAVIAIDPSAWVELCASDGEEDHPIALDGDLLHELRGWLDQILAILPAGERIVSEQLASPGPACSYCPNRHVCPAYRRIAPEFWKAGSERGPMPFDTWGTVTKVTAERDLLEIELSDAAARRVKLHRLELRHEAVKGLTPDMEISCFGLSAGTKNISHGRFFHPRNFFELPSESSERRAWSMILFAGT